MRKPSYNLDRALGFWLHLTHHKARNSAERLLREYSVTAEQWALLVRLWHKDGMTQVELAADTFRDKPSVTRMVDALEKSGYVERKPDPADRRSHRIELTSAGRDLEQVLVPLVRGFVARWTKGIPAKDLAITLRTLRALYHAL